MEMNINKTLVTYGKVFLIVLTVFVGLKAVSVIKEYKYIGHGNGQGGGLGSANTITVQGMGEVLATPDTADFTYTISEDALTAVEAENKSATKANAVLALVKAAGIKETDIKTLSYSLSPKYEYNKYNQTIIGYTVSQSVDVKVRKVDDAGALIAQVSALKVSSVSNVNFVVDKPEVVQDQAKAKAISDAQAKAKTLAKQLGVELSRIVSFSEQGNAPIYYGKAYATDAMSAGSVPAVAPELSVGQNKVVSNVSITYEIE